mgnify:CR=1 FL=1
MFQRPLILALLIASTVANAVDFDRQVRPLLADRCFKCHGPDTNQREAKLRLDLPPQELPVKARRALLDLLAGDSELVNRINASDLDEVMPPPESGLKLSAAEKKLLGQWVAEGAKYSAHWSFVAPKTPDIPKLANAAWCRNEIDFFIGHQLEEKKQI